MYFWILDVQSRVETISLLEMDAGNRSVVTARRGEDLLLVSQLLLRSLLVQVRAVELVQAVLRLLNKLQSSVVLRLELEEVTLRIANSGQEG